MFKHRGHFLNSTFNDDANTVQFAEVCETFASLAKEILDIHFPNTNQEELSKVLSNRKLSKTNKSKELEKLLGVSKNEKVKSECCKAIAGRKVDVAKIFTDIEST